MPRRARYPLPLRRLPRALVSQALCNWQSPHIGSANLGSNLPVLWRPISGLNGAKSMVNVKVDSRMLAAKTLGHDANELLVTVGNNTRCFCDLGYI
jgi:hypothetical protein